ncbi:MAG: hypothetical protein ACR2KX_03735, partial [Chitinophagaceae bacterium]
NYPEFALSNGYDCSLGKTHLLLNILLKQDICVNQKVFGYLSKRVCKHRKGAVGLFNFAYI